MLEKHEARFVVNMDMQRNTVANSGTSQRCQRHIQMKRLLVRPAIPIFRFIDPLLTNILARETLQSTSELCSVGAVGLAVAHLAATRCRCRVATTATIACPFS